jgi:DNA repair protein SbcC/Rad50
MILRSIRLENIRSYTHETIEFPEGSVLLSGDIGSGKSTILLAIEFAFFGIMRAELSGASLLRHGKNTGSVELKFEISDKEYIIKRALKRARDAVTQDTGYIITDGRKFEGTPVELKARIIGILGYPEELISKSKSLIYRYTVYTPQEEMKHILFEDKDMRLDTLRKLFGIDKYKTIRENAVIFIREIKNKQSELSRQLEFYDELKKEKEEKTSKIKELSLAIENTKKETERLKAAVNAEKEKLSAFEDEIKKHNELKRKLDIAESQMAAKKISAESISARIRESKEHAESLAKRLESFKEMTEPVPEKDIEKEVSRTEEELTNLVKNKAAANEKLALIQRQAKTLETEIETLSESSKKLILIRAKGHEIEEQLKKIPEQQALSEELQEKEKKVLLAHENILLKINESESIISEIKDAQTCPTCSQVVDSRHREMVIEKEKKNIESCRKEKEHFNENLKKIRENLLKIKRNLDKLSEIETSYRATREEIVKLEESGKLLVKKQKELSSLYEQKSRITIPDEAPLRKELEQLKKRLSAARDHNLKLREKKNLHELIERERKNITYLNDDLSRLSKETQALAAEKENLSKDISKYAGIAEKHEKQKEFLESAREKLQEAEIEHASKTQEKKSLESQVSETEKRLKSLEKTEQKIKKLSELLRWFDEFFLNLMVTMEKHIMISIHREFDNLLKEWFSLLIEDLSISLDDEFSVRIMQDGYDTGVESLSGGEKTAVALAYRLSLNKVVNDLIADVRTKDLIILDEPTDGFSTEQLDRVRDVLLELNMRQTIIVSHEPKMESYVENIIRIVKADNISKVSR